MSEHITEGDVETRIIVPAIEDLGYAKNWVDSKHQVCFYLGRRNDYGFSDYDLFFRDGDDDGEKIYTAVIEAKKPGGDRIQARNQARSYATSAQINAPFYAWFDDSTFELYDVRFPNSPVVSGATTDLYPGSSLLNELRSWISPLAAAEFLRENRRLEIPRSVLGQSDTIRRDVQEQVQTRVDGLLGGHLVGRDSVVNEIVMLSESGTGGVVALTGPVGVGKSAIATEVYRRASGPAKAVYYFSEASPVFNDQDTFFRFLSAQLFPSIAPGQLPEIAKAQSLKDLFWSTLKGSCNEKKKLPKPVLVVVDGLDQVETRLAEGTAGVMSNLARECVGLTVVVSSQPPLPESVQPDMGSVEIGLLDKSSADRIWDSARSPEQTPASGLGNSLPRLPVLMRIALQSKEDSSEAVLLSTIDDLQQVFGMIWQALTDRQRQALGFVCTDFKNLTLQELAELLNVSPSSVAFKQDIESIRRVLDPSERTLVPLDPSLRTFVEQQLTGDQSRHIWMQLLALREREIEQGARIYLNTYLRRVVDDGGLDDWVREKLSRGNSGDFNVLDSVWDDLDLPEYGDEGQLRLRAALRTSQAQAGRDRKREFVDWLIKNPNKLDEFKQILLTTVQHGPSDEWSAAVQCFVLMGNVDESVLDQLRLLVSDGQTHARRAAGARALVLLGSKDDRARAVETVSSLLQSGYLNDQVFVASRIAADPVLLDSIRQVVSSGIDDDYRTDLLAHMLAAIAERDLDDFATQVAVADIVANLHDKAALSAMVLSSQVTGSIDHPAITEKLLGFLDPRGDFAPSRHLVYLRATGLTLPRPLARLPERAEALPQHVRDIIRHDVVDDSHSSGPFKDWHYKDWATQFACFCALDDTADWLAQVLADSSPHVVRWICQYVGALGLASTVPVLADLLEHRMDGIVVQMGIADALGAMGNDECVEALIAHPPGIDSNVLTDGVHALTNAALSSNLVARVCDVATDETQHERSRSICIAAVEQLAAAAKDRVNPYRGGIWRIVGDQSTPNWWSVSCLRALCALDPLDEALERLVDLAKGVDSEVGWTAAQVLASWGKLEEHADLVQRLDEVLAEPGDTTSGPEAVLLTLYRRQPDRWAQQVASRIAAGSRLALSYASSGSSIPSPVGEAIADLLSSGGGTLVSQADIVSAADQAVPDELIARLTASRPFELLAENGPYLADAVTLIGLDRADLRDAAEKALALLCAFPDMATRCSAAEGLARIDPEALVAAVEIQLGNAGSPESLTAAADCLTYVRSDEEFERLIEQLEYGPLPTLRIYCQTIRRARHNIALADRYLGMVRQLEDGRDTLPLWRYGRAICDIGDRRHVTGLRDMAADQKYPSHVRFWFGWLAEDTEKSLSERFQKRERDLDNS